MLKFFWLEYLCIHAEDLVRIFNFSLFLPFSMLAQRGGNLFFKQFTMDDGLPSSEVYGMEQDDDGYLWFVTDNGIARFDGYRFVNFSLEEGLPELVILKIKKDPQLPPL